VYRTTYGRRSAAEDPAAQHSTAPYQLTIIWERLAGNRDRYTDIKPYPCSAATTKNTSAASFITNVSTCDCSPTSLQQ
jgi:hypothetical protein